jgi:DNA-binding NarL/FixJ family response regulator
MELIGTPGFGYPLKDRVLHLDQFDDALHRVAADGVALDPDVVQALVHSRRATTLDGLTGREAEVLELVAQGHSNTAISVALGLSERTVETHMRSIFAKLGLFDDGTTHRRVRAVVTYFELGGPDRLP